MHNKHFAISVINRNVKVDRAVTLSSENVFLPECEDKRTNALLVFRISFEKQIYAFWLESWHI